MIGYKAFDRKLCCRGFQYEIGKTYTKDVKKKDMKLCTDTVFHFCREIQEIEHCSSYDLKKSRICEVIAGDVVRSDGKYGTNKITILREIKGKEKSELLNSGLRNTGYGNTGSNNSGSYNSGVSNSGDMNTGNCNKGFWNTKWAYLNEMVEPQNEQNSAAATKSKFKVGDWVVHNDANTYQIQEIRNNRYELVNGFGDKLSVPFSCRYSLRPWTLFDAKDGDVLISCRCIFIFNKIDNNWVKVHCFYHPDGSLIIENYGLMTLKYKDEVFPATKEQRDTLFQKLEEKGYKWDAENEEVMKLIKTDS